MRETYKGVTSDLALAVTKFVESVTTKLKSVTTSCHHPKSKLSPIYSKLSPCQTLELPSELIPIYLKNYLWMQTSDRSL